MVQTLSRILNVLKVLNGQILEKTERSLPHGSVASSSIFNSSLAIASRSDKIPCSVRNPKILRSVVCASMRVEAAAFSTRWTLAIKQVNLFPYSETYRWHQ